MRIPPRATALAPAALIALLAFAGTVTPVAAWSNRGDGYGTHDWILDQALRLLDARGISHDWVNRTVALQATDDPDTVEKAADETRKIEHVYTAEGRRGGAIDRITEHYAKILHLYEAGKDRRASYNLGMLAHFWGDIAMPYHTNRAALEAPDEHAVYELLVNDLTRAPTDMPAWSAATSDRTVSGISNVRTAALAMAAYSRVRYELVHENLEPADTVLNPVVSLVTGEVLVHASGDLADLISSVASGMGNPPPVGSVEVSTRWYGVKGFEPDQYMYATVRDVNGDLIEGVRVDGSFPSADGVTTLPFWTDETGEGRVRIEVGDPALMVPMDVSGRVTTDRTEVTAGSWYYRTEPLADGAAGFSTQVREVRHSWGQEVVVTTSTSSAAGQPIAGLLVDWTWTVGGTPVVATGYTNRAGVATTRFTLPFHSTAEFYVYAHTSAYSVDRRSKAWYQPTS